MGAEVVEQPRSVDVKTAGLVGAHIELPFPSVGATENLLLAAVKAKGTTIIHNAAVEPEVMDLIHFLQQMGALVDVQVDRTIIVEGVDYLRGARHTPISDRIEVASYAAAAVATGGRIEIVGARQRVSDEDWVQLGAITDDADYVARFQELFGVDIRPPA